MEVALKTAMTSIYDCWSKLLKLLLKYPAHRMRIAIVVRKREWRALSSTTFHQVLFLFIKHPLFTIIPLLHLSYPCSLEQGSPFLLVYSILFFITSMCPSSVEAVPKVCNNSRGLNAADSARHFLGN